MKLKAALIATVVVLASTATAVLAACPLCQ